ncbi:MAG: DUF357 domain-containing protein [Archaeoglobales archaeon]|nr:DUF357 domain-containing protein [Archaeoglobi archaeon]NHW24012.1 DUF357 domain-containing protein [Archaeoglobales archaeon]TDA29931.1 MAG: DUF357 domain-containing protein [Archaeoglobi archaeon]
MIELKQETEKWLGRIKERIRHVDGERKFMENIRAYISDSEYFMSTSDFIRAFECVIWAWAWLEIGLEIGMLYEAGPAHGGGQIADKEDR